VMWWALELMRGVVVSVALVRRILSSIVCVQTPFTPFYQRNFQILTTFAGRWISSRPIISSIKTPREVGAGTPIMPV
jgi:hypothetical protein